MGGNEIGISSEILKKMPCSDIFISSKKFQILHNSLDNIVTSLSEADAIIHKLNAIKDRYQRYKTILNDQIEAMDTGTLFNKEKIEQYRKDSQLHTKKNLIEKYKNIEIKYSELIDYYQAIDTTYYKDVLQEIINEMYE